MGPDRKKVDTRDKKRTVVINTLRHKYTREWVHLRTFYSTNCDHTTVIPCWLDSPARCGSLIGDEIHVLCWKDNMMPLNRASSYNALLCRVLLDKLSTSCVPASHSPLASFPTKHAQVQDTQHIRCLVSNGAQHFLCISLSSSQMWTGSCVHGRH